MYNKSMGYILEKMRGDTLTPLGTKRITEMSFCIIPTTKQEARKYEKDLIKFLENNTFFKGKWVKNKLMVPGNDKGYEFYLSVQVTSNYKDYSEGIVRLLVLNSRGAGEYRMEIFKKSIIGKGSEMSAMVIDFLTSKFGIEKIL